MTPHVLFISYLFPPVGGAGVQRVAKFVKYLPRHGWAASVLTVANPSVPVFDNSLLDDIPDSTIIRRARTLEPSYTLKASVSASGNGNRNGAHPPPVLGALKNLARRAVNLLLQPDPQVLWVPQAIAEGARLLAEIPHAAILASGPPFSSFIVGAILSHQTGLPLVLDYRDEWDISNAYLENKQLGAITSRIQQLMQHRVVRAARTLIATTAFSAAALERVRDQAHASADVTWIYNGFDPDDFPDTTHPHSPSTDRFRLAYIGTLWNLTSVAPLVDAIISLNARRPDLVARLELIFAGRRTPAQSAILQRLAPLPCRLIEHPYLDHSSALELMRSADALCVLLSDVPEAQRVVPAKIFECMAARQPIFTIAPPGETWRILRDYPLARLLPPSDIPAIDDALAQSIELPRPDAAALLRNWDSSHFDRRSQARQLASILDQIGAPAKPRPHSWSPALAFATAPY